jgi:hypothetical protein
MPGLQRVGRLAILASFAGFGQVGHVACYQSNTLLTTATGETTAKKLGVLKSRSWIRFY